MFVVFLDFSLVLLFKQTLYVEVAVLVAYFALYFSRAPIDRPPGDAAGQPRWP